MTGINSTGIWSKPAATAPQQLWSRDGSERTSPGGTPMTGAATPYRLLERPGRSGTLFTYLRGEYAGLDIASTTNGTHHRVVPLPAQRTASTTGQAHQNPPLQPSQDKGQGPTGANTRARALQHRAQRRRRTLAPQRLGRTNMTRPTFTHVLSYNPRPTG